MSETRRGFPSGMRTRQYIGASGNRLVADEAGPPGGPAVLLLHGGGQTRHSWKGSLVALGDHGWHAIGLDLRGHGESDWIDSGDYSLTSFAEDVLAVLRQIGAPTALVGASLGGASSILVAGELGRRSGLARGLVLVDIAHRTAPAGRHRVTSFMRQDPDGFASIAEASRAVARHNRFRSDAAPGGLERNLRQRRDGRWVWHWDPRFLFGEDGLRFDVEAVRLGAAAGRLDLPVLLVRGEHSDVLDAAIVDEFVELVPDAEVAVVPGAGHMLVGDRNDVFTRALMPFLARLPGAPRRHRDG